VLNYAFDVTPGKLLRGIITEKKAVVGNYETNLRKLFTEQ